MGLPKDSAVYVTAVVTLDRTDLDEPIATLPDHLMHDVASGLRPVLDL